MAETSAEPGPGQVVRVFARVGLLAFGGGVSNHLLAAFTRRGWLTDAQFLDALSWCQNMPGPNATNLAAFLGWRFAGVRGALGATVALVVPGAALVVALGLLLPRVPNQALVRGALAAVAAAAVGLLVGTIVQLARGAKLTGPRALAAVASGVAVAFGVPTPLAIALMVALLWPRGEAA